MFKTIPRRRDGESVDVLKLESEHVVDDKEDDGENQGQHVQAVKYLVKLHSGFLLNWSTHLSIGSIGLAVPCSFPRTCSLGCPGRSIMWIVDFFILLSPR